MKSFLVLFALVSMTLARPSVLVSPLSNVQAHASASASASSSSPSRQLSLLQLVPGGAPLGPDGRVLDTLEVRTARAQHEAAHQRAQAELARANARDALEQVAASASPGAAAASASVVSTPLAVNGRVLDTLEVSLAKAEHAAAHPEERLRLAQVQARGQQRADASALLSATRLAQSLASVSPSGVASSSRVQLVESPELSAVRAQQQALANLHQNLLLARDSVSPLVVSSSGQLVSAPVVYV